MSTNPIDPRRDSERNKISIKFRDVEASASGPIAIAALVVTFAGTAILRMLGYW